MIELYQNIDATSQVALILSAVFLITTILSFDKSKLIFYTSLFLMSTSIALAIALIDPFLHLWDEQFHALVSKNLSKDFLHPTLIKNPPVELNYKNWVENEVWLHKPPLSLWQIALSFKIFGQNLFALRLPSIIMHGLMSLLVYRIGEIVVNKRASLLATILFTFLLFPLELSSGTLTCDHVDVCFMFYITCSVWSYIEFIRSKKYNWLLWMGVFVGLAILTKLFVGLLIFFAAGILLITFKEYRKTKKHWLMLCISLLIALSISLPWSIYTFIVFPTEAINEFNYSALHFNSVIEGHGGDSLFYFKNLKMFFGQGDLVPYSILLSVILIFWTINERKYQVVLYSTILVVFLFFTMSATKMVAFTAIVLPLLCISLASLLDKVLQFIPKKTLHYLYIPLLIGIALLVLQPSEINKHHFGDSEERNFQIEMNKFCKENSNRNLNEITFYDKSIYMIGAKWMFWGNSVAISGFPDKQLVSKLQKKGFKIKFIGTKQNQNKIPQFNKVEVTIYPN